MFRYLVYVITLHEKVLTQSELVITRVEGMVEKWDSVVGPGFPRSRESQGSQGSRDPGVPRGVRVPGLGPTSLPCQLEITIKNSCLRSSTKKYYS